MTTFRPLFRRAMTLVTALIAIAMSCAASAAPQVEIPRECAKPGAATCAPDKRVVKRLCQRKSQDAALRMFKPGTPWKRLYIRDNIETRYSGSRYAKRQPLRTAEQVLVLVDRAQSKGGMTVSGYGNYDVLRFNGHCTTVMASDLFQFRPTVPDFAPIRWTRLKSKTRKALLKSKGITWRAGIRKNVCKSYGKRSLECEGARLDLARLVAERVHKGQAIPILKFIP
ncbi:MAG: hypothetical protein VB934_11615 [Polyangiaceae bacterium]